MDTQDTLDTIFKFANLGAQTYLQDRAITSPRPSTVTLTENGQIISATGGGALPIQGSFNLSSPGIWLAVLLGFLFLIVMFKR